MTSRARKREIVFLPGSASSSGFLMDEMGSCEDFTVERQDSLPAALLVKS